MSDEGQESKTTAVGALTLSFLILLVSILLVFTPLILALVEHALWRTHHVEQFVRSIGIHDILSKIYDPVLPLIR